MLQASPCVERLSRRRRNAGREEHAALARAVSRLPPSSSEGKSRRDHRPRRVHERDAQVYRSALTHRGIQPSDAQDQLLPSAGCVHVSSAAWVAQRQR